MITLKSVCYWDLPDSVDKADLSDNGHGAEDAGYLLMYVGDKLLYVFSDAMEPEDARFSRDLSWIKKAIEEAYYIGVKEGTS